MSRWTNKRRLFIEKYFQCDFNATEAARQAGFKHPNVAGSKLVKVSIIKEEIDKRLAALKMDTDEALRILAEHVRFDPGPYLVITKDETGVNLKALRDAGLTKLVKSITPTKDGLRIEFEDRQTAINMILKASGAYREAIDLSGEIKLKVVYENGTDDNSAPSA